MPTRDEPEASDNHDTAMLLPHAKEAVAPLARLTDYLLSLDHPVGRSKAKFLRAAGFNEQNVEALSAGFRAIARENALTAVERSAHGTKYVVVGQLATPGGSALHSCTVWIIENDAQHPRFVTAYPHRTAERGSNDDR